jgi:hypothetical protein
VRIETHPVRRSQHPLAAPVRDGEHPSQECTWTGRP